MTEDVLAAWSAQDSPGPAAASPPGNWLPPVPRITPALAGQARKEPENLTGLLNNYYGSLLSADALSDYYGGSDFWNYGLWHRDTGTQEEACLNLLDELLSFLPAKHGKILDVACGKGATTRYLLDDYAPEDVIGINISPEQLDVCRRNAPGVTFLVMDAARLSSPTKLLTTCCALRPPVTSTRANGSCAKRIACSSQGGGSHCATRFSRSRRAASRTRTTSPR